LREKIETYQLQIKKLTFVPNAILPYLHVGRVIRVKANDGKEDWGYGYMINFKREKSKKVVKNDEGDNAIYIADIMIYIKKKPVGEEP
jgi:ATP-dependent RNA helicase DOB1